MGVVSSSHAPVFPAVLSVADHRVSPFGGVAMGISGWFGSVTFAPTANRAHYVPVIVRRACVATQMAVQVATQSGNIDVGIYNDNYGRLVSSGSTAMAAPGVQVFDITDTPLAPGRYWLAVAIDNTTARIRVNSNMSALTATSAGAATQTSAFPLPSTMTPAAASTWHPLVMAALNSVAV